MWVWFDKLKFMDLMVGMLSVFCSVVQIFCIYVTSLVFLIEISGRAIGERWFYSVTILSLYAVNGNGLHTPYSVT